MLLHSLAVASYFGCLLVASSSHAQSATPQLVFFDEWSAALDAPARGIIAGAAELASQNPRSVTAVENELAIL